MSNLSEEEKQVLQTFKNGLGLSYTEERIILSLIDRLQNELYRKNELILDLKEKLNNIQFEVETAWRKIEKVENNNE